MLTKEHQQKEKAFSERQANLVQQLKSSKSAQNQTQTAKSLSELERQLQNANKAKDKMRSEMNAMKIQTEKAKRDSEDLRLRMRNLEKAAKKVTINSASSRSSSRMSSVASSRAATPRGRPVSSVLSSAQGELIIECSLDRPWLDSRESSIARPWLDSCSRSASTTRDDSPPPIHRDSISMSVLTEAVPDPDWNPFLTKITKAKESKLGGDYETSLKLEMSMAADAMGLKLMQLNESFADLDSSDTGSVTFDQIADGFMGAATTAGLNLMMDTQLVSRILRQVQTEHGANTTSPSFDFTKFAAVVVLCGRATE